MQSKSTFAYRARKTSKKIIEKRLPFKFDTYTDMFYSRANFNQLRQSIAQLNAGKGAVHELIED